MHHLALTVRDLDASVEWYGRAFGLTHRMDLPHPGGFAQMLSDDAWQLVIALHHHDSSSGEAFVESHTGLDHAGLAVPSRDDPLAWQSHLETQGVVRAERADRPLTQSPIADEPYGSVLVLRDPDNIQLELFAPPAADE
ncbi:VOC family protein [Kineococcus indalonis]|uniref:VOC family protein n=1 Tax=Kineococcus indalonis TaxID=2696566 RepID=UPI001412E5B1|nr:VOC family protein [Kineococcus indalonis]NAZ84850.1 VOC family protein [Kineococcus indalonis]